MKRPGLPHLSDAAFGVVALLITAVLIVLVEMGAVGRFFSAGPAQTISANFADARQLTKGDPVRISGVQVGTVKSVTLDPGGHASTVQMSLMSNAGHIYENARAQALWRTLLGGDFYVDLNPGSATSGALRGAIPVSRTDSQVEIDDVTSIVAGQAKTGLQKMGGELSQALADPQYPATTLNALSAGSSTIAAGVGAARGTQPATDLPRLIDNADTALAAVDAPYGELQKLVSGAAATVQATAARSSDLQQTLSAAPGLLDQASTTMVSLRHTLALANPLLANLTPSAPQVAPTVRDLRGTVEPADTLLAKADPLLSDLRPAVTNLASAAQTAEPLLTQITPSLDDLSNRIVPYINEVQPDTKHTFAEMVGPGLAALGAIGAYVDNDGGIVRFPATSGNETFYLPCTTYINNPTAQQIVACESVQSALTQLFSGGLNAASNLPSTVSTVTSLRRSRSRR